MQPCLLVPVLPGLSGSWSSADPGLTWILGSVEPGLHRSTGLRRSTGLHGSTDSADPQAPQIHNSTIQLFYIKIIMSTENHPTLMNANDKMSIT